MLGASAILNPLFIFFYSVQFNLFTDYSQQQSHPLLPIPLLLVASSLNSAITHITISSEERQNSVKVLLGLLRYMSHSNHLASTILQKIVADIT
jgi:hypothetical protein